MNILTLKLSTVLILLLTISTANADSHDDNVLVQSTTSTANSGLYKYLLPLFEAQTGITVNVVAVGTGQAIQNARNCDADVLLVHAKSAEENFVAEGYGVERFDLMYNDFVLVGPRSNPAKLQLTDPIQTALQKVVDTETLFASRGDDSGTHKKELSLWSQVEGHSEANSNGDSNGDSNGGLNEGSNESSSSSSRNKPANNFNIADEPWYRSTGSGMGATINTAIGLGAYTLTDRATWISFNNKQDYTILTEGDPMLFNQYGVIQVSPDKCTASSHDNAEQFISWLLSDDAQQAIAEFKLNGQQLFYPNAE